MIHLPSIKTLIYTIEKNKDRQCRIADMLRKSYFSDWRFIYGTCSKKAYWQNIHDDFIRLLNDIQPPFIFLEDDATTTQYYEPYIEYPKDSDVVYLGGTINSQRIRLKIPDARTNQKLIYTEYNYDYIRIYNMHSTHAILFLKDSINKEIRDTINNSRKVPVDVVMASNMHRWKVYCRKHPFWYQQDGKNDRLTQIYYR
jgi:hypothetical protein